MKSVAQVLIVLGCSVCFIASTGCSKKASDLLSESSALKSSVQIQSSSVNSVGALSGPVIYEVTYINVLNNTLTADDIILSVSGTANCTKSVDNVTPTSAQVILSECQGDGVVRFRIAAGSAVDISGEPTSASLMSSALIIDNTGISTVSFNILPGAYSAIPSTIDVYFPEAIVISPDDEVFTVTGTCEGVTVDSFVVSSTSATINLLGTENCVVGETVILVVQQDNVTDAYGNDGIGTSVGVYTVTDTGPTSGVYSPASSAIRSNFNVFTLTLPGFIDPATVDTTDFIVSGTCSSVQVVGVSMSGSDATVQVSGVENCLDTETIILTTDLSGINDISGNLGQGIISVTYVIDSVPPNVVFSTPSATLLMIPSNLDIVFSPDTNMNNLTAANFEVSGSCSATLASFDIVGQTVTLNLSGTDLCSADSTVIVTVRLDGVSDFAGNVSSGSIIETYVQQ